MKNLYERLKEEYRGAFKDYEKEYTHTAEIIINELKQTEFVSKLTYGCVVTLQSATNTYGNAFDLFEDE